MSLCLDLADLVRESVALPAAFRAVKKFEERNEPLERVARRMAGTAIRTQNVVPGLIDRIKQLFERPPSPVSPVEGPAT